MPAATIGLADTGGTDVQAGGGLLRGFYCRSSIVRRTTLAGVA